MSTRRSTHQAASGYLTYDPGNGRFTLPPEQAMVFAEPDSPVYLQPAFGMAAVMLENQPLVEPAFRSGKGVGWGNQSQCLFCTTGRFFRPGYQNNLVGSWLPTLDGVAAKLESGAKVADVGCGHGFSTIIMAKAFPKSTFVGYDFHPDSVAQARVHAEQHGPDHLHTIARDHVIGEMRRVLEAEDENRKKALEDLKFKAGDQWPADVAQQRSNDKRPCLTINTIPTLVHQVSNDLRQNRPAINISPMGGVSDKEKAFASLSSKASTRHRTAIPRASAVRFRIA